MWWKIVFAVLTLTVLLHEGHGWSGNKCYRTVCSYRYVWRCAYRTWSACCYYRRYREPYYYRVYFCCPGWRHNGNQNCNIPICNPTCKNDGTCISPNRCRCRTGNDGPTCEGVLCSHERPCYPGTCSRGPPLTCSCSSGFTESGCIDLQDNQVPQIYQIQARMSFWPRNVNRSMEKYALLVDSTNQTSVDFIWTNRDKFNWLNVTASSEYSPSGMSPRPAYVQNSKFGITKGEAHLLLKKLSIFTGGGDVISLNMTIPCEESVSSTDPEEELYQCNISKPNFDRSLENGDELTITFRTNSGGFRDLVNLDNNNVIQQTYNGQSASKAVQYRFDFAKPIHCGETLSCTVGESPLHVDKDITRYPVTFTWAGWKDTLSGMFRYAWEVFKLEPNTDGILHEKHPLQPLINKEVMHSRNISYPKYTPLETGMYSVILEASDRANNSKFTRRVFLYDKDPVITLNTAADSRLYISSASNESGYTWQYNRNAPIVVKWTNHFANLKLEKGKLLNSVKPYPQQLEGGLKFIPVALDDNEGSRTIKATPNVHGIIKFEITSAKDSEGGRNQNIPNSGWRNVNMSETDTLLSSDVGSIGEGDTVTVWVRAHDPFGNTKVDSTKVSFDSSPPVVSKTAFSRNVKTSYAFSSRLVVKTKDQESGIDRIDLTVSRKKDNSVMHRHSEPGKTVSTKKRRKRAAPCDTITDCYLVQATGKYYLVNQEVDINNCWLIVDKQSLDGQIAVVRMDVFNNGELSATRTVEVTDLIKLNGAQAYLGPMNISSVKITENAVRLTWDHAPSCYERTEMWINYEESSGDRRMEKLHADTRSYDLAHLNPGTNYTIQLISQYGAIKSTPRDFSFVTLEAKSEGLSGGAIAGIVIGVLLIIALILLVLFFLWRTGRLRPRKKERAPHSVTIQNTLVDSGKNFKMAQRQMYGISVANNAYSADDDIYMYGSMEFEQKQPWHLGSDELTLLNLILTGRFAKIYKASWKYASNKNNEVVAKALKDDYTEEDMLVMMAKINFAATQVGEHPNIVTFLGAVVDNEALGPVMVLEYCETGQLDKWLTKQRGNANDDTIERLQQFTLHIASAMEYLVSKGIVHRKLAARNILLTFLLEVKVMGFGPSRMDETADDDNSKGDRIPIKWTAPECLTSMKNADEKSDVWSYGIVLWEIFSLGETPYPNIRSRDIPNKLKSGYRLGRPEFCEDVHYRMMQDCWSEFPKGRPTFRDILDNLEKLFGMKPSSDFYYYQK